MSKRTFTMNGNQYTSMMDIARELGVKRVYPKDFDKYGIVETTGQDAQDSADVDVTADTTDAPAEVAEVVEEVAEETVEVAKVDKADKPASVPAKAADKPKKEAKADKPKKEAPAEVTIDEAIAKKGELDIVGFNAIISKFSVDKLAEMAEKVEVENMWDSIENAPIRKMRLLMEIKTKMYPGEKTPVKPASVWKKVDLDTLVGLADENGLEYRKVDNTNIQRMWVIKALQDAGVTPDDIKVDAPADTEDAPVAAEA